MPAHPVTHPSVDALRAFALGKLNDSTAAALLNHLDGCPDCYKQVAAISGDDFLVRLRRARSDESTSTPAKALSETAGGMKPAPSRPAIANLPPELAANQQYEIQRELGRGGMGVVYLAKNKLMDRLEVLKVVNKTLLDHPAAIERFLREIRSAAKLSHANVVAAYSAVQQGELLAFAMEYIEGQDLASLVKSQGPLSVPHACFYVQQAAHGLQHAHEKGMVHRDIKPQNLILAREGKKHIVKVLDFGLAKVMREKSEDTGLTGEGKMLGTPDYVAPEQTMDAAHADIRADIYSLGCTLYYLLSGHPPFSANSLGAILVAHQMHEAKPLNLVRPEVPEELAAVVRKMMAKTPAKRYQTPREVVQVLGPFVKQGATPKESPGLLVGAVEAKPIVKKAAPAASPPVPIAEAPQKQAAPADVWGSLIEGDGASVAPQKSALTRKSRAATVRERSSRQKWLIGGGLGVAVLLVALLGMWAGGMFEAKVQVKTKDGILEVVVNEANADVYVDDQKVRVSWQNGGKKAEIHVKPGTHKVEIKKDGFSMVGKELTFKDGDRVIFTAQLLPDKREAQSDAPRLEKPPPQPEPKKPDTPRVADAAADAKGFVPLFNGKDLTGWKTHPKQPNRDNWRVQNGILIGSGPAFSNRYTQLYTQRGDYKDFHLHMEVRINDGALGDVFLRSQFGPVLPENNPLYPFGYAVTINSSHSRRDRTGSLWVGLRTLVSIQESPPPPNQWFYLDVIAQGEHILVKVDGRMRADYRDTQQRLDRGHVALQAQDRARLEFRKIEIKELPAPKSETPPGANAAAEEKGFVPLFNGKSLSGSLEFWSVTARHSGCEWKSITSGSSASVAARLTKASSNGTARTKNSSRGLKWGWNIPAES